MHTLHPHLMKADIPFPAVAKKVRQDLGVRNYFLPTCIIYTRESEEQNSRRQNPNDRVVYGICGFGDTGNEGQTPNKHWMIQSLDREASRLGVPRQSLIKMVISPHPRSTGI